jgi:hypothetical protein
VSPVRRTTPSPLDEPLAEIADALAAMARGEDRHAALLAAVDKATRTALVEAGTHGLDPWRTFSETFRGIIGDNVKKLRLEAQWTQAQLGEAMTHLGFDWKRITVAEIEVASRRISFEELTGLAVLFAVPVIKMLLPTQGVALDWAQGDLTRAAVEELLVGRGGTIGTGGVDWAAAARAVGNGLGPNGRPAVNLWRHRSAMTGAESSTQSPTHEDAD